MDVIVSMTSGVQLDAHLKEKERRKDDYARENGHENGVLLLQENYVTKTEF